jgi:hypothetical protein
MQPSGSDPDSVVAIQKFIYAQYMERIPVDRTEILWLGPMYEVLFALTLIAFFAALVFGLRPSFGNHAVMTELTSFSGKLTERAGELRPFSMLCWTATVVYAGYFAVNQALFGITY